jgi:sugar O-acyltransferase (sialic acid O-acetyltransferase NeuD family)
MDNILIIGSSRHAKVVIDIIEQEGKYRVGGLLDDYRGVGAETLGYSVIGKTTDLITSVREHSIKGALIAIGDNDARSEVAAWAIQRCPDLPFVTAVHPSATVASTVHLGAGTVIMAGAVINPCCSVGQFCVLNTNSTLDHDSVMEDFSSLAPGATVGGSCQIGTRSAVGIGATLAQRVTIGSGTVVGAASLVLDPIEPGVVAYGIPARAVRARNPGDRYL